MNVGSEESFKKQLADLVKTARRQGMSLTKEQVLDTFLEMELSEDRLELIYDYLRASKIAIDKEADLDELLTDEDKSYLEIYIEELNELPIYSESQKTEIYEQAYKKGDMKAKEQVVQCMLSQVVEIAKIYSGQGVLIEDLIGEGNVALAIGIEMIELADNPSDIEAFLAKNIMEAMEDAIIEESEDQQKDDELLSKINKVAEHAKELAKDLGRNITIEELARETQIDEQEIKKAMIFTGNKIDYIEKQDEE